MACSGTESVIKFDFDVLSNFVNVPNLLQCDGLCIDLLNERCHSFDKVLACTLQLIEQDDNIFACMALLISIMDILRQNINAGIATTRTGNIAKDAKLRKLIGWTEQHYAEKVTLDDAANAIGYGKYYFCTYFKKQAGISYLNYLNQVRIYNACKLLTSGESVQSVCTNVGFESVPYFTRLFKSIQGITPKQYAELTAT